MHRVLLYLYGFPCERVHCFDGHSMLEQTQTHLDIHLHVGIYSSEQECVAAPREACVSFFILCTMYIVCWLVVPRSIVDDDMLRRVACGVTSERPNSEPQPQTSGRSLSLGRSLGDVVAGGGDSFKNIRYTRALRMFIVQCGALVAGHFGFGTVDKHDTKQGDTHKQRTQNV